MDKNKGYVIVMLHTHWDLQWYLSRSELSEYLSRQVKYLVSILEEKKIPVFVFDGQVAPILEFLETHPEYHEIISSLIAKGVLEVGPWYTQPDTFLVSGESLIRNLVLGIILSEKLGSKPPMIAYLPDSFGLTPQLPEILSKANINIVVFERGMCHELERGLDFKWASRSGRRVLAYYLLKGYCGASFIGCIGEAKIYSTWTTSIIEEKPTYTLSFFNQDEIGFNKEKAITDTENFISELERYYKLKVIVMPMGCDQYIPRRDVVEGLEAILDTIRKLGYKPVIGGLRVLKEHLEKASWSKLYEHVGELRCARYRNVLWGTASTRITIKQLSFKLEQLLQGILEPLLVIGLILGIDHDHELHRNTWLKLLRSQFHDAICGTVTDHVARRIENELEEGLELARYITYHTLASIVKKADIVENTVIVYNPLPYSTWNTVKLLLPASTEWKSIVVEGDIRPLEKIKTLEVDNIAEYIYTYNHRPLSITVARPLSKEYKLDIGIGARGNSIWNQYIEVLVDEENATIIIRDKRTGFEVPVDIVDYGDYGDVYDYNEPEANTIVEWSREHIDTVTTSHGSVVARAIVKGKLLLPKTSNAKSRSKELIENPYTLELLLYDQVPRLELVLKIKNNSANHVLRLRIPRVKDVEVYGNKAFIVEKLDVKPIERKGPEVEPLNHVVESWIALRSPRGGIAIALNGLHEVFVKEDYIEITLYRSTGWLSRSDLKTRKGHAGPPIPTPEAQYQGRELVFNIALIPFTLSEWVSKEFLANIEAFYRKPATLYNNFHKGSKHNLTMELLELPPQVTLSALKPREPERGNGIVVRIANPWNKPITLNISKNTITRSYGLPRIATLDEEVANEEVSVLELKPYSIETLVYSGRRK